MPDKNPEKKPFYSAKVGKSYDYKKNNEGIAKLADSNKKMGALQAAKDAKRAADYKKAVSMVQKPKPKSKDEIKSTVRSMTKSTRPKADKPAAGAMRSYRASKGDSLYSIAEKTLPKGKNLSSWFGAIKKMNAGRKLYSNTGVSLPPGSSQYKQGMPYAPNSKRSSGITTNKMK